MTRPDDVTDAMVDAAFGDLLDGTGNANWASRPNREIMRGALARAINASGCVLVPREPSVSTLGAGVYKFDQEVRAWNLRGYREIRDRLESILKPVWGAMLAAAAPREQALDRMAENAQELGLYDTARAALQGAKDD